MTWKSYAAASGATVLAGWLASAPPSSAPGGAASTAPQRPGAASETSSDIEVQAMRLQARAPAERRFTEPRRNPFRFDGRPSTASTPREAAALESREPEQPAIVEPARPVVSVAGIAEDQVDGRIQRTAVLSSPAGVLLVREGEEVLGRYRVARIESEAVELVERASGETLRLTLGR